MLCRPVGIVIVVALIIAGTDKSYMYHKKKFILQNEIQPTTTKDTTTTKTKTNHKTVPADYGLPMVGRADVDVLAIAFEGEAETMISKSGRGAALRTVYFIIHRCLLPYLTIQCLPCFCHTACGFQAAGEATSN